MADEAFPPMQFIVEGRIRVRAQCGRVHLCPSSAPLVPFWPTAYLDSLARPAQRILSATGGAMALSGASSSVLVPSGTKGEAESTAKSSLKAGLVHGITPVARGQL